MTNLYEIVIDANIARSSSEGETPLARGSTEILKAVSENGHKVIMCKTLHGEWRKHQSRYAQKWFVKMTSNGKVRHITPQNSIDMQITSHFSCEGRKDSALKDKHLIEVAMASSKIIASNDSSARSIFSELSTSYEPLREVKWFNATSDVDFLKRYLQSMCRVPAEYYLTG